LEKQSLLGFAALLGELSPTCSRELDRAMTIRAAVYLLASLAYLAAQIPASAKSEFDGPWRVTTTTTSGDCDRVLHYRIVIIDGRVMSGDITGVSGHVAASGAVTVKVSRKEGTAVGSGRLSGSSGGGHWTVRSPSKQCAGEWSAERVP
jgi:hypothetical protein